MPADAERLTFARQRQDRLLRLLRSQGSIVVREVAEQLGVSQLTIRRDINALAGRGLLTRVHGGATLPDEPGPGRGSRFTIGMVVPHMGYYWPEVIAGAQEAAAAVRARLVLRGSSYDIHDDRRQIGSLAGTAGLDGLIVAPDVESPEWPVLLRWLDSLPVPVVLAERRPQAPAHTHGLESVASDHAAGAAMAVRHLHEHGHRRIGLLTHKSGPAPRHLLRGWRAELRELGLDPDAQLSGYTDGFTEAGREVLLDALLDDCRRTGTTALILHSDPSAVALVQHCADVGLAVPGRLAVVAYDDEVAALCQPPVTAVRPPKRHVGRSAGS
ncbi:LacI family DNA-binding transcriptional regulator [Paractinoplanes durhamensis]|uniref:LacI family DNA-binding transcriptional regulator n=1 Tax=Paractinoplanes durhamensis TaxID=113563 RepID=UPI0036256352